MTQAIDLSDISAIHMRAEKLLDVMTEQLGSGKEGKSLDVRFNVKQAAELVGRTEATIRKAEKNGDLEQPKRRESGQRDGYSLEQINRMRDHFGTRPYRDESDEPVILGFQNFKGGVSKSTLSVHAAQYLALQGYRVLLIDLDPQASATLFFGLNPALDIDGEETALPYFAHEADDLRYAIRKTYWDGLDIIPSCLELYNAEYMIAGDTENKSTRFETLRNGVQTVAGYYDVVVMDAPPALGMISLNALRAANALIVPTPSALGDYGSTVTFLRMLVEVFEVMKSRELDVSYSMVKVLAAKLNNSSAQIKLRDGMKKVFGDAIFSTAMIESVEYNSAAAGMRTIYEYTGKKEQTYRRCRSNLDKVMGEIEESIRMTWPSHRRQMRQKGAA